VTALEQNLNNKLR